MKQMLILLLIFVCAPLVSGQDIMLELTMPSDFYMPGSPFSLDLDITNNGPELSDAQMFVVLTLGTGEYWFYPSWSRFPGKIDWKTIRIPNKYPIGITIIPPFSWPWGAGEITGARFFAAVLLEDELISNVAEFTFSWVDAPETRYIPPGTFIEGSPDDEPCREFLIENQRQVTLTRGLHVMKTEVTRGMWANLRKVQPHLPPDPSRISWGPTPDHPAQNVTWFETIYFANTLSIQLGLTPCYYKDAYFTKLIDTYEYSDWYLLYCDFDADGFRLPTEAEWEYAARAGTTGPFFDDEPNYNRTTCNSFEPSLPMSVLDSIAWWVANSDQISHPVGLKRCNPWGLYDMHGNVSEWCLDWWCFYGSESVTDPANYMGFGFYERVYRGGATSVASCLRSATRTGEVSTSRENYIGFRLVRTAH